MYTIQGWSFPKIHEIHQYQKLHTCTTFVICQNNTSEPSYNNKIKEKSDVIQTNNSTGEKITDDDSQILNYQVN